VRWFSRRKVSAAKRDEIRAKAHKRLVGVPASALIPMSEGQLAAAWQAFDRFQDHPELVTLTELAKTVSVLQGTVDALQEKFEAKL
jgi:hypothetical protein